MPLGYTSPGKKAENLNKAVYKWHKYRKTTATSFKQIWYLSKWDICIRIYKVRINLDQFPLWEQPQTNPQYTIHKSKGWCLQSELRILNSSSFWHWCNLYTFSSRDLHCFHRGESEPWNWMRSAFLSSNAKVSESDLMWHVGLNDLDFQASSDFKRHSSNSIEFTLFLVC